MDELTCLLKQMQKLRSENSYDQDYGESREHAEIRCDSYNNALDDVFCEMQYIVEEKLEPYRGYHALCSVCNDVWDVEARSDDDFVRFSSDNLKNLEDVFHKVVDFHLDFHSKADKKPESKITFKPTGNFSYSSPFRDRTQIREGESVKFQRIEE